MTPRCALREAFYGMNALKEKAETLNETLAELTDEELAQVDTSSVRSVFSHVHAATSE